MSFRPITTVYSYYLPEVRRLVDDLTREFPHEVFLRSVDPGLDDFHLPVMDKLVRFHAREVSGLADFPWRYPTAGSEEGIREYFTALATAGGGPVYAWKGDYEGYREVARSRGLTLRDVETGTDPASLPPGHWFVSNPSARDGMVLPAGAVRAVADAGHRVFYDLSYLGTTAPAAYDLMHPNVDAVALSFSKPYGLFYYRIGFLFSRREIPVLYANRWFKNVFGLLVAERILDTVDQSALAAKYRALQGRIVAGINAETSLGLLPSDVFLLAHLDAAGASRLDEAQRRLVPRFARGDGYRFCLTPCFLDAEGG